MHPLSKNILKKPINDFFRPGYQPFANEYLIQKKKKRNIDY